MKTVKVLNDKRKPTKMGRAKLLSNLVDDLVYENKLLFTVAEKLREVLESKLGPNIIKETPELHDILVNAGEELAKRHKRRNYVLTPME